MVEQRPVRAMVRSSILCLSAALLIACGSPSGDVQSSVTSADAGIADTSPSDSGNESGQSYQPGPVLAGGMAVPDAGTDAPVDTWDCFLCGDDIYACANECTALNGFITGDGRPYHCCHW
jgi:hypothetical protein